MLMILMMMVSPQCSSNAGNISNISNVNNISYHTHVSHLLYDVFYITLVVCCLNIAPYFYYTDLEATITIQIFFTEFVQIYLG